MNRKNEFEAMIEELNRPAPGLETTLERAYIKKRKRTARMIVRPVAGLAACFAVFVLLVNFCVPVAYACSQVPVLRELAAAVTFSRSLTDAVENEYVQTMDLKQTENDITLSVEYLIVDQKQVNVFYRLTSDQHKALEARPNIYLEDGESPSSYGCYTNGYLVENGDLCCMSIDFEDPDVPSKLVVKFDIYTTEIDYPDASATSADDMDAQETFEEPACLAEFAFTLEFDPKFTASGKVVPLNQTVILDGQSITITDIEVYPTHMRVDIQDSPDNTAWLTGLDFYIETDWGMKFEAASNGIISTGSVDSPSMVSYRADSTYFYEAKHLKLVITGAQWLRKDMQTTYLNLATGEHGQLPEGVVFDSAEKQGNDWLVTFRADWDEDASMYQLFGQKFFDADANAYEIHEWSPMPGEEDEKGNITYFYDAFSLKNYPFDEVWLSLLFSHNWVAEDRIFVNIQ